ncbi:MAG: CvpA family protein [Zoogloeaceae bacterium]|jgi:membrane protein required for colicin V production|nr:CvpA family protein [Zoogloeaceae bacterium]
MTAFDYGVLGIIGLSLSLGLWRGMVGEVVALAAWVLAFLAARAFGAEIGQSLFASSVSDENVRILAGWALVFMLTLVLMALVQMLIRGVIRALGLGFVDRFLGLLFGALRGLLIVLVLVIIGGMTPLPREIWWAEAKLAPPLEIAVLALQPWLPEEMTKRIKFR